MESLMRLKLSAPPPSPWLRKTLNKGVVAQIPARKRECKRGKNILQNIKTVVVRRFDHIRPQLFAVMNVEKSESNQIKVKAEHKRPANHNMLPTFLMMNLRSFANKIDEFQTILMKNQILVH